MSQYTTPRTPPHSHHAIPSIAHHLGQRLLMGIEDTIDSESHLITYSNLLERTELEDDKT